MGSNYTKSFSANLSANISRILNRYTNEVESSATARGFSDQRLKLVLDKIKCRGAFNLLQESTIHLSVVSTLKNDVDEKVLNDIAQAVEHQVKQTVEQMNKEFNLGQANIADIQNVFNDTMISDIKNEVRSTLNQKINISADQNQEAIVLIKNLDVGSDCNISQIDYIEGLASAITNNVQKVLLEDTTVQKAKTEYDALIAQKNIGVNMIAVAIILLICLGIGVLVYFKGVSLLTNPKFIILIVCIVLLLILLGYYYFFLRKED